MTRYKVEVDCFKDKAIGIINRKTGDFIELNILEKDQLILDLQAADAEIKKQKVDINKHSYLKSTNGTKGFPV